MSRSIVLSGHYLPGDEHFTRVLMASGDQTRRHQLQVSRGCEFWYVAYIQANGGPESVMCTTSMIYEGHRVEILMQVALARRYDIDYRLLALVKILHDPEDAAGFEIKPLLDFDFDEEEQIAQVESTPPIPPAVMDSLRARLGLPQCDIVHPDNRK